MSSTSTTSPARAPLSAELTAQTEKDAETFQQDYARLLTLSRLATAPSRFFNDRFGRKVRA